MNYYNEIDPFAAQWLRNLIEAGLIPKGHVDERSIVDVSGSDLNGFIQCHFFAGIGGWPYALQLAGWPEDRPVWTGSCPCQPFSVAGKGAGTTDERHLWPAFRRLISERRPPAVFGEQVASKAGRLWLAGVRADLEELGYAVGAADLCAAGVGAPHIRQRLFWVAESELARRQAPSAGSEFNTRDESEPRFSFVSIGLADAQGIRRGEGRSHTGGSCRGSSQEQGTERERCSSDGSGLAEAWSRGAWYKSVLIPCADEKARRIPLEPALFPLADGLFGRVGLLKGAGNAIVPQAAAEFIGSVLDII